MCTKICIENLKGRNHLGGNRWKDNGQIGWVYLDQGPVNMVISETWDSHPLTIEAASITEM